MGTATAGDIAGGGVALPGVVDDVAAGVAAGAAAGSTAAHSAKPRGAADAAPWSVAQASWARRPASAEVGGGMLGAKLAEPTAEPSSAVIIGCVIGLGTGWVIAEPMAELSFGERAEREAAQIDGESVEGERAKEGEMATGETSDGEMGSGEACFEARCALTPWLTLDSHAAPWASNPQLATAGCWLGGGTLNLDAAMSHEGWRRSQRLRTAFAERPRTFAEMSCHFIPYWATPAMIAASCGTRAASERYQVTRSEAGRDHMVLVC